MVNIPLKILTLVFSNVAAIKTLSHMLISLLQTDSIIHPNMIATHQWTWGGFWFSYYGDGEGGRTGLEKLGIRGIQDTRQFALC